MSGLSYSQAVADAQAYITVTIDLEEPIELTEFVGLFASMAKQFDDYLREAHPDLHGEGRIYLKEVRQGSIVADLIPAMAMLVQTMDTLLIVKQFSEWMAARVGAYVQGNRIPNATKSDIAEIADMVKAVAHNNGEARFESIRYVDGKAEKALELVFDSKGARTALETVDAHKADLDKRENADFSNVLMVFVQANVKEPDLGKRSGERVRIEKIDRADKPITYESELARQRIKTEIDTAGENVFKKGFFVDLNVEYLSGRIAAYKIKHVHDVIDIDAPEEPG